MCGIVGAIAERNIVPVLVEGLKRVKTRGGNLTLVATQDKILKIFDITGLNKAFPIFSTRDDALKGVVAPEA